jgi:lipoate---protein ligase
MRLLDHSFWRPEENLAFDEVLLDRAESGRGHSAGEVLRFWESRVPFVVLGVSQTLRQEVFVSNCEEDRVPIMRRCSAGGCVLQGPGCLNYSMVISHDLRPQLKTLRESYCFILESICEALKKRGVLAHHKGVSDLAIGGKKVSGSAQKRRRHFFLHHGTLLYNLDPEKMDRYLREPEDRPQYRGPRTHAGFLRAIPLTPDELRQALREAFDIKGKPSHPTRTELLETNTLAYEKYLAHDWIWRK